jgi:hypothetical protein
MGSSKHAPGGQNRADDDQRFRTVLFPTRLKANSESYSSQVQPIISPVACLTRTQSAARDDASRLIQPGAAFAKKLDAFGREFES